MKTVQKLELYSSITTMLAVILQLFLFIFYLPGSKDGSVSVILAYALIFLLFPSLAIFAGTYFHVNNVNSIGFPILMFFGSVFIFFYGGIVLLGLLIGSELNKAAITGMIIWLFPSFFVGCTMILAVINALSIQKNYES